eukprot:COSAG01_NODE_9716_length_2363_cov_3.365283_3_plen_53_part_00
MFFVLQQWVLQGGPLRIDQSFWHWAREIIRDILVHCWEIIRHCREIIRLGVF